jgi:hypothetical protein
MSEDCHNSDNLRCDRSWHTGFGKPESECKGCQYAKKLLNPLFTLTEPGNFEEVPGTTVACYGCGEAVTPDEAYLCEFENPDGSKYTVVFHKGIDRMCPLKWAVERLVDIAKRLENGTI